MGGRPLAYYNEHDLKAAAWLRELIREGLIADGDVDTRSILDVRPGDLAGFTQAHFFAGIGGWSLALRLAGWDDDRPVWTGSCPCQPFSAAGAQAGGHDDRDLWPAWFQLLRECRPGVVFGEQVEAAIAHGWLDRVCDDLEGEGYAVGPVCLPAASVGAFHIRQRLWFTAEKLDIATTVSREDRRDIHREHDRCQPDDGRAAGRVADTASQRRQYESDGRGSVTPRDGATEQWSEFSVVGGVERVADTQHPERRPLRLGGGNGCDGAHTGWQEAHGEPGTCGEVCELADDHEAGRREQRLEGLLDGERAAQRDEAHGCGAPDGTGDTEGGRQREHGRAPGDTGHVDEPSTAEQLGHTDDARSQGRGRRELPERADQQSPWAPDSLEWLPCRDGKARPTEPGLFPLAHGVSARVGRLRGYGNAIVPQVAAEVIRAYMESA